MQSQYRALHVLRAALKLGSLIAFFAAFATAPLADATAIAFTAPIFVTLGAWIFMSERPRALRVADPVEQSLLKSAARKLFDLSEDD